MKIAHAVTHTENMNGLYESAREIIAAERALGIEAEAIDPTKPSEDRGSLNGGWHFLRDCDVIVDHSGLNDYMIKLEKPTVHCIHGWPRHSFLCEWQHDRAIYKYMRAMSRRRSCKAQVTFWPELAEYLSVILPKVTVVPAPIDLEQWKPEGPDGYKFGGKRGKVNIVVADTLRAGKDPYDVVNAFALFAKTCPGAKLHMYGMPEKRPGWDTLLGALDEKGWLGEVTGMVSGIVNVYRAADAVITPWNFATRIVREVLACGRQVVMGTGGTYSPYYAAPQDIPAFAVAIGHAVQEWTTHRQEAISRNRAVAAEHFDVRKTAAALAGIYEKAIGTPLGTGRKAKGPEHYDKLFTDTEHYRAHYTNSPYYTVWSQVVSWLTEVQAENRPILELGCGTGQLAEYLISKGFLKYQGRDFSPVAIESAKNAMTGIDFEVADVTTADIGSPDYILCMELLEHLEDDLGLLRRIPAGTRVIFSVPDTTMDDDAHLRLFGSIDEVKGRYGGLIDFRRIVRIDRWFVAIGTRKAS